MGRSRKARTELNWKPEIGFEQLVKNMVDHDVKEERLQRSDLQKIQTECTEERREEMQNVSVPPEASSSSY